MKSKAFARKELLEQDVKFKLKFYYAKNASYETAHIGTVQLVPNDAAIKDLSVDYEHMKDMIYGEKPTFNAILETIRALETEINELHDLKPISQKM